MLRQISIFRAGSKIFEKTYARAPDVTSLIEFLKQSQKDVVDFINIVDFKIGFAINREFDLFFTIIGEAPDDENKMFDSMEYMMEKFFRDYPENIIRNGQLSDFKGFEEIADEIFEDMRNKITIIGYSGTGKTTMARLIEKKELPRRHIPTITGEEVVIPLTDRTNLYFWDSAGQEKYSHLWKRFIIGSDVLLVVTDSTYQNVFDSSLFLKLIVKHEPNAKVAIIANKQDLPDALKLDEVEKILPGYPVFPFIALDPDNREKILQIIFDLIGMIPFDEQLLRE
ncbi:MAG: GTP-binding protein [Candidatus Lokiarchaeota archaeon]|nr:GTP-binding protein [Candidatus Lokiarchaeota archaeon]